MDSTDIINLNSELQQLYEDRWPGLTPRMALAWRDDLRCFSYAIIRQALRKWYGTNTFRPPGLDNIIDLACTVQDEQDDQRRREQALERARTPGSSYGSILSAAAAQGREELQDWQRLHMEMFYRGLCIPARYDEAAEFCEQHAQAYPEDTLSWQIEAAWWRGGARGRVDFS